MPSDGRSSFILSPNVMERHIALLAAPALIVLLHACKKDDPSPTPGPAPASSLGPISNFSKLAQGNYWIYDRYKVNADDNILETLSTDSIWVAGDTVLNGETYKIIRRAPVGSTSPSLSIRLWRDSLNYLVERHATIPDVLFCTAPLDQVIYTRTNEVEVTWEYTVVSTPLHTAVPAGTFTTYMMDQPVTDFGTIPEQPEWKRVRSYWAEGVGRVRYYIYFASAPYGYRYDLVRYQVN